MSICNEHQTVTGVILSIIDLVFSLVGTLSRTGCHIFVENGQEGGNRQKAHRSGSWGDSRRGQRACLRVMPFHIARWHFPACLGPAHVAVVESLGTGRGGRGLWLNLGGGIRVRKTPSTTVRNPVREVKSHRGAFREDSNTR